VIAAAAVDGLLNMVNEYVCVPQFKIGCHSSGRGISRSTKTEVDMAGMRSVGYIQRHLKSTVIVSGKHIALLLIVNEHSFTM
jgi:hypothetical protein